MSARRNRKQVIGIPDTWALCGLYALLLLLFIVPGIIIDGQPISAWTLMHADLHQYGQFPGSTPVARQMVTVPALCIAGLALTLTFRTGTGKYAFGACISMLLFALTGVYAARHLPHAGGFVIGMTLFVSAAIFFVSIICAVIRRQ